MPPVELSRLARRHLNDGAAYCEGEEPGLGERFIRSLGQARLRLEDYPAIGQHVERGVHRLLVTGFPYAVYYRPEADRVLVVAIVHSSRHPDFWKRSP